jgi:hypothetical protein
MPDHNMSSPAKLWTDILEKTWGFMDGVDAQCLPPPNILNDAHTQLLATLRPEVQLKAAHATTDTAIIEPTFLLYSVLDGGEVRTISFRVWHGVAWLTPLAIACRRCDGEGAGSQG